MSPLRLRFTRGRPQRHWPHGAFIQAVHDALDRAKVPVARQASRRSRPVTESGPPLPLGYTSRCEYIDAVLARPMAAVSVAERLAPELPDGIRLLWQRHVPPWAGPLRARVREIAYCIEFTAGPAQADAFNEAPHWPMVREKRGVQRRLDLKESVTRVFVRATQVHLCVAARPEGTPKPEEILEVVFGVPHAQAQQLSIERRALRLAPHASYGQVEDGMV